MNHNFKTKQYLVTVYYEGAEPSSNIVSEDDFAILSTTVENLLVSANPESAIFDVGIDTLRPAFRWESKGTIVRRLSYKLLKWLTVTNEYEPEALIK